MVPLLDARLGRDVGQFRAGFARIVNAPKRLVSPAIDEAAPIGFG